MQKLMERLGEVLYQGLGSLLSRTCTGEGACLELENLY
jgi:hypothetical protein